MIVAGCVILPLDNKVKYEIVPIGFISVLIAMLLYR